MRNLLFVKARPLPGQMLAAEGGVFTMFGPDGDSIRVIATSGLGWDHVSVSLRNRCPTWAELELVKRTFFHEHETAMQLHVPPTDHVNNHEYCLHLWRPHDVEIPRPPSIMVGFVDKTPAEAQRMRRGVF